jgi:PAS domain S-box-containing protein
MRLRVLDWRIPPDNDRSTDRVMRIPAMPPERLRPLRSRIALHPAFREVAGHAAAAAARALGAPFAAVSLMDGGRRLVLGRFGAVAALDLPAESPMEAGPCTCVFGEGGPLAVPDLRADSRFAEGGAAAAGVRGYLGVPLRDGEGRSIGVLCAVTGEPRAWSPADAELLASIAVLLDAQIRLLLDARPPADDASRTREELYRTLVTTAAHAVYALDPEGRIAEINPAGEALLERSMEDILGRHFGEVVAPEDLDRAADSFVDMLCGRVEQVEMELRLELPCGARRWTHITATSIPGPGGTVVGVHGIALDVSEQKRAEEALRRSEERFRVMVEGSEEVFFFEHDGEGHFTYLSPSVHRVLGYPAEELLGAHYEAITEPTEANRAAFDSTRRALRGVRAAPYVSWTRRRDGRVIPVEIVETPVVRDGRVRGVQGIARDISERTRMEARLRQSGKMEAVGQLAGGVAHDFNNMLMAIGGFATLLEGAVPDGEPASHLREIRRATERASHLTRQLLAFGRRQVLHPEALDLSEVARGASEMLRRLIPAHVRMELRLGPGLHRVEADRGQLEQVLMNLLVNARDAMPDGGAVFVETSNRRVAEHDADHPWVAPGDYVALVVRDTGRGMDAEVLEHIWEPFFTTKDRGAGTGLGLSTAYGIVRQSGGHIWAESDVGIGSTFTVLLPRVSPSPSALAAGDAASALAPRAPGAVVLLAEDEDAVRTLVRMALSGAGHTVLEARNGTEALRLAAAHPVPVDLLLTDVVMPGMGGRELAERLSERSPTTPIVFLSGYAGDALAEEGSLPPGTEFLQKPVDLDVLLGAVARVLEGPPPPGPLPRHAGVHGG